MPTPSLAHQAWTPTDHHVIHGYLFDPLADPSPLGTPVAVLVPGLGLPQYLFPTAEALSRQGVSCAVLDVPGFAAPGRHGSRRDVTGIGRAAAEWVRAHNLLGPLVVFGHSTGAQGALDAALRPQDTQPGLGLRHGRADVHPSAAASPPHGTGSGDGLPARLPRCARRRADRAAPVVRGAVRRALGYA